MSFTELEEKRWPPSFIWVDIINCFSWTEQHTVGLTAQIPEPTAWVQILALLPTNYVNLGKLLVSSSCMTRDYSIYLNIVVVRTK